MDGLPENPTEEQARNALIALGFNADVIAGWTLSQLYIELGLPDPEEAEERVGLGL